MRPRILCKASKVFALPALLCIGTTACALASGNDLHGLKFVSVNTIDPIKASDVVSAGANPWPDRAVLVINFTSERDLLDYAKQHEYNIGNDSSFCLGNGVDAARPLQNSPYVFDTSGKVDAFRASVSKEKGPPSTDLPIYHVYVSIAPIALAGRNVFAYDLRQDPEDICVQLRGGNMLGGKFVSDTIIVPKAAVVYAMAHR